MEFWLTCTISLTSSLPKYTACIETAIFPGYLSQQHDRWFICHLCRAINSSPPPSAAYMRQWTRSAWVQVMSCRLVGANPLPEPMLVYCQLDPQSQTSVKFESAYKTFHIVQRRRRWQPWHWQWDKIWYLSSTRNDFHYLNKTQCWWIIKIKSCSLIFFRKNNAPRVNENQSW